MKYRLIKYIGIKFFPNNKLDYLLFLIFNILFSFVFIFNIQLLSDVLIKNQTNSYLLLLPTDEPGLEEKKDIVFSKFSINQDIISVIEVEHDTVLKKLEKKLNYKFSQDDLIPQVFEIILKKNKKLELEEENEELKNVIKEAELFKKVHNKKKNKILNYLILVISFLIFFVINIILNTDYINKIKYYLTKLRNFGVKDKDIIINISCGYILTQYLGIGLGYSFFHSIEFYYKTSNILLTENIVPTLIFILLQCSSCLFSTILLLRKALRRVL